MFRLRRRKHRDVDYTDPDLPIIPMLDLSFQLLFFFVVNFQARPIEGQIFLSLPKEEGGGAGIPSVTDEKPARFVVKVFATDNGTIQDILFTEPDGPKPDGERLGPDSAKLFEKLKEKKAELKDRPAKLTIEMSKNLLHVYVVKLLDEGMRAGFTDIAPVPLVDTEKKK